MDLYTKVVSLTAFSVVVIQQILKLKLVPLGFANRHPIPTLLVLSTVAGVIAATQNLVTPHNISDWLQLIGTIVVLAALTYNMTIHNWAQLRQMEGES